MGTLGSEPTLTCHRWRYRCPLKLRIAQDRSSSMSFLESVQVQECSAISPLARHQSAHMEAGSVNNPDVS